MINITEINKESIYPIRNAVLRKGKPIESCYFIDDEKDSTKHYGIFFDNKIIGCVSLFEQKNNIFLEKKQFQIRGMAIIDEFQQKGFGKLLIERVESYCLSLKAELIWFNARENAVKFYKKLDYTIYDEPFDIENIGIHYVMFKKLI